jgi:hypothetical protein
MAGYFQSKLYLSLSTCVWTLKVIVKTHFKIIGLDFMVSVDKKALSLYLNNFLVLKKISLKEF